MQDLDENCHHFSLFFHQNVRYFQKIDIGFFMIYHSKCLIIFVSTGKKFSDEIAFFPSRRSSKFYKVRQFQNPRDCSASNVDDCVGEFLPCRKVEC